MALQVAAILDTVAFSEEWQENVLRILNDALAKTAVSPGYHVMASLAERNYALTSDESGKLCLHFLAPYAAPNADTAKLLGKAQARIVVDASAFKEFQQSNAEWEEDMYRKRKIRIEGDPYVVIKLDSEIGKSIRELQDEVESKGPGRAAIEVAQKEAMIQDHSREMEQWKSSLQIATQDSLVATKEDPQTEMIEVWGWLMFSAPQNWFGNTGQSNYCAANIVQDSLTLSGRQMNRGGFMPLIVMWGAVGGIGMRWKAFASQDFLMATPESSSGLFDAWDAMGVIKYMIFGNGNNFAPEISCASKFDQQAIAFLTSGPMGRTENPWGKKKGKGGGLSFESGDSSDVEPVDQSILQRLKEESSKAFRAGDRVQVCDLVSAVAMNGATGTLIEEVSSEKWQVHLDDVGDKLIKNKNLKILDKTADFCPTEQYCLAGSWNDWMPQNMVWNQKEGRLVLDVEVADNACPARFGVAKGQAGTTQWRNVRQHKWSLSKGGKYRIRLVLKEGGILKDVVSERVDAKH